MREETEFDRLSNIWFHAHDALNEASAERPFLVCSTPEDERYTVPLAEVSEEWDVPHGIVVGLVEAGVCEGWNQAIGRLAEILGVRPQVLRDAVGWAEESGSMPWPPETIELLAKCTDFYSGDYRTTPLDHLEPAPMPVLSDGHDPSSGTQANS